MKLSREEGNEIVWGDNEDWEKIESEIIDQDRWTTSICGVFKHLPTGKFYEIQWIKGSTEYQEQDPFDLFDPEPIEVRQVEKLVKVWEVI